MKKLLASIALLALTLSFAACGNNNTAKTNDDEQDTVQTSATIYAEFDNIQNENDTPTASTTAPTDAPVVDKPVVNEFFNDENNFYEQNDVSVRPRHLYWKDGELVAECFVINGYDTPVTNINVQKLAFTNDNGTFANAAFGVLDGLTLEPYTHAVWTFTFGSDCISQYNADLSDITYNASTKFNY